MAEFAVPQVHGSQLFTTAGAFTFTVPSSYVGQIMVIAQGAGGGGSGSNSAPAPQFVGGRGAICVKTISVTGGEQFTGTIGAGGAYYELGTSGAGGNGGATTFTGTGVSMSAGGGLGGECQDMITAPNAATGGDYNCPGDQPASLNYNSATKGSDSLFGLGGANASGVNVSGASGGPGAGGGALTSGSSTWGSGTGGPGAVLVIW